MKTQLNEIRRMQQLAGIITENESPYRGIISFGPFKNIEWYTRENNQVFLTVTESDNFRNLENELEYTSDEFTDEQIDFLNNKVEELAQKMSDYLTSVGIKNEIYDNPIGYGQEIDNLVIAISLDDFDKLTTVGEENKIKENYNRISKEQIARYWSIMIEAQPDDVIRILTDLTTGKTTIDDFITRTEHDVFDSFRDELYNDEV